MQNYFLKINLLLHYVHVVICIFFSIIIIIIIIINKCL